MQTCSRASRAGGGGPGPTVREEVGVGKLAVGEHLLLVLIFDVGIEVAGALLGGFERGDANGFVGGGVVRLGRGRIEIDEGGGHLSPVAKLQRALAEAAAGDDGDGIGGAAVDLDEGDETFAVGGAGSVMPSRWQPSMARRTPRICPAQRWPCAIRPVGGDRRRSPWDDDTAAEGYVAGSRWVCGIVQRTQDEVEEIVGILWRHFALGFSALLPLVNPLGSALVFLGLVGIQPAAVYKSLARQIAINMMLFLAVIELIGSYLLSFFGISMPIVQFAGGIVVAAIGWGVLNQSG